MDNMCTRIVSMVRFPKSPVDAKGLENPAWYRGRSAADLVLSPSALLEARHVPSSFSSSLPYEDMINLIRVGIGALWHQKASLALRTGVVN